MSLEIAIVLFALYIASLFFSLKTHRHLYTGEARPRGPRARRGDAWSIEEERDRAWPWRPPESR